MSHYNNRQIRSILWPLFVSLTAVLLYLFTLAPTVLWGDDAYFQRVAFTGELRADGGGHWLWLQLARLFVRLPWGDVAFRSNLLSAVAAGATIFALYAAARQAGLHRDSATVAVVSLAIGHTFWMHAVRAEVYTLFTLFVALHFWLWARWKMTEATPAGDRFGSAWPLYAGMALFGATLLAHQMALFLLPGWLILIWTKRRRLRRGEVAGAALALLLGLVPFLAVIQVQIVAVAAVGLPEAIWLYFTHAGADFSRSLFDVSAGALPSDLLVVVALTVLQFCGPALLLILWGLLARGRARLPAPWASLLVLIIVDFLFAATYRVNDRYVFLLPGYLALSLFAGAGWQAARAALASRGWALANFRHYLMVCLFLLIGMPIAVYYAVPRMMVALDQNPLQVRTLPGREPNEFFLWPGKRGYVGALHYGEETLATLPAGAMLVADHTPVQTLKYLQEVVGLRQDVRLVAIQAGNDLAPLLSSLPPGTPIFLADSNPDYYNLRSLPEATLANIGPIFRLELPAN